jgi:hypothetical protein
MKPSEAMEIHLCRNRTKQQRKIYLYEAMCNMLEGFAWHSTSENVFALTAAFLEKTGHRLEFLKTSDRLLINDIRRAITPYV